MAGLMTGRVTNFMRWLKALVIGMGILIVVGTVVMAVMLARRSGPDGEAAGAAPAAANGGSAAVVARRRIVLPAGARVVETVLDGDRVALRIALANGAERVVIIDIRTGRRLGTLDLAPEGGGGGANPDP
jgi:hypothetical protein